MSKAFVKEDVDTVDMSDLNFDPVADEMSAVPGGEAKNYITPAGLEKLKASLAEIAAGPDADRRARLVRKHIDLAEVIDPLEQPQGKVLFGATVTVLDESENRKTYQIVGVDETDFAKGKVSWISPIAKALLQAKEGDVVTFESPRGDEELEIEKIEFKSIH
ncbi:MAG: transcription elongation factor GreB [Proteobacteria bacterium]|nr:MAG: transcription elongation factor GreB [Pseudomonadota bacterium]